MAKRLMNHPKIVRYHKFIEPCHSQPAPKTILWNTVATECQGDGDLLTNLRIKNIVTGEEKDLPVNGLFYAIGRLVP